MNIQKIPINLKVPKNLLDAIDNIAERRGVSRTQFILEPIRKELNLLGFRIDGNGDYCLQSQPKPYTKKKYRHWD
jgi:hypothetical protein